MCNNINTSSGPMKLKFFQVNVCNVLFDIGVLLKKYFYMILLLITSSSLKASLLFYVNIIQYL